MTDANAALTGPRVCPQASTGRCAISATVFVLAITVGRSSAYAGQACWPLAASSGSDNAARKLWKRVLPRTSETGRSGRLNGSGAETGHTRSSRTSEGGSRTALPAAFALQAKTDS